MKLIRDPGELAELLARNAPPEFPKDFDPVEWLSSTRNFALRIGDDLGMGEALGDEWPGDLACHVFFASRGRQVLVHGRMMLEKVIVEYGAKRILGEVPAFRKDVLLMARLAGFRPYGKGHDGDHETVLLALNTATYRVA